MWPGDDEHEFASAPRVWVKRQDVLSLMERALMLVGDHDESAQVWATLAVAAALRQQALATERAVGKGGVPT